MGFPTQLVQWISVCITSPRFSISLNGGLNGFLEVAAKHGVFKYHPKYVRMQLSHLSFANDLLMFAKGNVDSVSELFVASVSEEKLGVITSIIGFKIGKLLVRLQLIKAVLFSIQAYWCMRFLLPKAVLKKVSQICVRFFWEVGTAATEYILKGRSFWDISPNSVSSWNWRRMLKLKEVAACNVHNFPVDIVKLWEDIRVKGRKVSWHRLLWFPLHIPKHSIIAWMAILNRLPTRDSLVSMGLTVDAGCLLCSRFSLEVVFL
ncbi:uncharacterized protein [Gossypium hirsutum]|uniref:Reverse transcriptase zinc-binding domain-containing protein n=1 Tax=Gossypium hirsutum TaxID=3635 RepID=A0A1U8KFY5_GOSHI|nr:uncharacterized protein LOC107915214 [Gossypium hirsutum]